MDGLGTNSATPPDSRSSLRPSPGSTHQSSRALPPPALAQGSPDRFGGWKTIGGQQEFYDEEGFLNPGCNLVSEKLKDRKEDDVVIFDYSLGGVDRNPPVESGSSSGSFGEVDGRFFQVPKDRLVESGQFNQVISATKGSRLTQSRARLGIIDFPQCYDTSDHNLLNSMAKELHLPNPATFGEAHSKRVLALPGRGRLRTGFSLRVPPKNLSELAKPGSSEDIITLFVSFPYFGKSSSSIPLGLESESIELLDFRSLGDVPDRSSVVSPEDKDIGGTLVHQARYMIFDNYTIATFRSKEDSAKDQVPLHHFQKRIGAFHAMIQMIANRMDSELWIFGKLRASLHKLGEDIDQMILDAKTYEGNEGMKGMPSDKPPLQELPPGVELTTGELNYDEDSRRAQQNNVWKRKHSRVRDLIVSLNRLSGSLLAAISVAERQIAVLQNIRGLFLKNCPTEVKDIVKGYPLSQNQFCENIALIPILSENSEQVWTDTLDTINKVVRERECFITKVEKLVENMDVRRKILSTFLKADRAKAASSERTAREAINAMKCTEDTLKKIHAEIVQQGRAVDGFTLIKLAFLPLSFCTSFYGMQTIEEFNGSTKAPLSKFWQAAGPLVAAVLLLAVIIMTWKRSPTVAFRASLRKKLGLFPKEKTGDPKEQRLVMAKFGKRLPWFHRKKIIDPEAPILREQALTRPNPQEQPSARPSLQEQVLAD